MANNHSKPDDTTTNEAPEAPDLFVPSGAISLDKLLDAQRKNRKMLALLEVEQERRRANGIHWETSEDFDDSTNVHLTNDELDGMVKNLGNAIEFLEVKLKKVEDVKDKLEKFFKKKDDDDGEGGSRGGVFGSGFDCIVSPINL